MFSKLRTFTLPLTLLLLGSCASESRPAAVASAMERPGEVAINRGAGRGAMLFVTVRLEDGQELSLGVDTGAEGTVLDSSLEPKLGKRLGAKTLSGWNGKMQAGLYAAPKLFLGDVRLLTGPEVATSSFKEQSEMTGHAVMGVLGMDCLKHYCLQLDFAAGKLRFLPPGKLDTAETGQSFPLKFKDNCPFIHHAGLGGGKDTDLLIDAGCVLDGFIQQGTNKHELVELQKCEWAGGTYTNLHLQPGADVLGLKFLARHLVTLDFPNQTLYLKQTNTGPLVDEAVESAMAFLKDLKRSGRLPGWAKDEPGNTAYPEANDTSMTLSFRKPGNPAIYHYTVVRPAVGNPWQLQSAWQTDPGGKVTALPVQ